MDGRGIVKASGFGKSIAKVMLDLSSSHVYFVIQQAYGDIDWDEAVKILKEVIEEKDANKTIDGLLITIDKQETHIRELEKEIYHLNNVLLEQSDGYFPQYRKRAEQAEAKVKELEEGIEEVIDGTLPYLAEQRLKKLVEKK